MSRLRRTEKGKRSIDISTSSYNNNSDKDGKTNKVRDSFMSQDHRMRMCDDNNSDDEVRDEAISTSTIHPLLIHHITENILKILFNSFPVCQLELPEVLSCRLVCKCWNEIATKLYRRSSFDLGFGDSNQADTSKIQRFLRDMKTTTLSPFSKFRFDPAFFVPDNEPFFKKFLYSQSQWIVVLKIWVDNACTLGISKRQYPDLKLPVLEHIFFGCSNYRGRSSIEKLWPSYLFEALLDASVGNLRRLCLSFPPKDIINQQSIIKRFGDLIAEKVPPCVKNLKIEMKITDDQLISLTNIGLSLDALHCDFRGSKLSTNAIYNFLEQQRNTLQELRLLDSELKYNFQLQFPRFEKLSVFEIQGGEILPFSYKDKFPVLEKLMLFGWENGATVKGILTSATQPDSLESLELPYKISDPRIVYMASKCFPNLKILEITPTEDGMDALTKVFECMEQLEILEITFPFIVDDELHVDSVFTGISKEDCDNILTNTKNLCFREGLGQIKMQDVKSLQRRPAITDLKKLTKLAIQDHSSEIRLTDITAYIGLIHMESLQKLEIGRFQISDEVFQLLQDKFEFTQSYESSESEFDDSDDGDLIDDDPSGDSLEDDDII